MKRRRFRNMSLGHARVIFDGLEMVRMEAIEVQEVTQQPHNTRVKGGRDDYETPRELFDTLRRNFKFNVDAAASDANALCAEYYTEESSFLKAPMTSSRIWCNPPFNLKDAFLKHIVSIRDLNHVIVAIVPNNCRETDWWNTYALQADLIINLTPRVQYLIDGKRPLRWDKKKQQWVESGVAFGSALLVYYPRLSGVEYGAPKELYWRWDDF